MTKFLNSELLPRRNSSRFCSIKKKKIEILLNWINLEKKKKKFTDLKVIFTHESGKLSSIRRLSMLMPFQIRVIKKSLQIILPDNYEKLKTEIFSLLKLKSINKITNYAKFTRRIKSKSWKNPGIFFSEFILIDKKIKKGGYNSLKKINNKNRRLFTWLNIKNKISIEILKSLSIIHSLNHNSSGISVKLPKKICSKNLNHNIVNLIGGGFEYICSGKDSLSNISFKAQLLPTIRIYFKK